jgi:hypothetical protein
VDVTNLIKIAVLFFLHCMVAPFVGLLIRKRPLAQRILFFVICFMSVEGILEPGEWGLTIEPILYRGHERGFHFYFIEVLAEILIFARMLGSWRTFRFLPPGLKWWLFYCFACSLSLFNAPFPDFVWMSILKFTKITLIFVAAWNYFESEEDLEFFCGAMSWTMMWEAAVVLKLKYKNHIYQANGTFEHQNALSMFAIMIGMVFLAMGMGPKSKRSSLYLAGFLACAIIVQSSLSRAGLAIFGFGTVLIVVLSLIDKPTIRRWAIAGGLGAIGAIGLAFAMDTIIARFNDYGNDESKHTREMLNDASKQMVHDYPLGIGWNNFAATINHPFPYGNKIDAWQRLNGNPVDKKYPKGVVESVYYLHLAETGYQGLIAYVFFMTLFLWWNFRGALTFRNHTLGCLTAGIGIGCGLNYIQSTLERVLTQPRNLILWMLLLAATSRIELWRKEEKRARKQLAKEARKRKFAIQRYEEPEVALQ